MEEKTITSPIKAIRAKCLDCCCGSAYEVKLCVCQDCSLWAFRFGKNPYIAKRELSDERRAELAAKMETVRLARKSL